MPGELEMEIKQLLGQLLQQRDDATQELKAEIRELKVTVGEMGTKITTLTARDETITEMRATVSAMRTDVTRLQAHMAIGGVVAGVVLAAVVGLVFKVFAGA